MLRKFWDSRPHTPHLSTMLLMFNLHNAMTFNIDYEQSAQKVNDQVLKGEVIEWSHWDWSFDQVWCPFVRVPQKLKKNSLRVNMVLRGTASKFEAFVWILAITTNLNMIFCVVFIAWLKFETSPSFLLNLKNGQLTLPSILC